MLSRIKATKGFTLLELLVVLLIIGILAAIAVPSYQAVRGNAAERAAVQSAEMLARNAEAIAFSSGSDSVSLDDFTAAAGESGLAVDSEEDTHTVKIVHGTNPQACVTVTLDLSDGEETLEAGDVEVGEAARDEACEEEDDE